MGVSRDDVAAIAALARLRPDDESIDRLAAELTSILDYVQTLSEVDLAGEGGAYMDEADGSLIRPPELAPDTLESGVPASLAPSWEAGFFCVPRLAALDGDASAPSGDLP